jgi:membrane associated rhomboid family serine protease
MDKRANDHVAHDAHFWGAVFGFFYSVVMAWQQLPVFVDEIRYFLGLL